MGISPGIGPEGRTKNNSKIIQRPAVKCAPLIWKKLLEFSDLILITRGLNNITQPSQYIFLNM